MRTVILRSRWRDRLFDAAGEGREVVLKPAEALEVAQHLDRMGVVNLYLEAAIRQSGGRLHLDTPCILQSTGEAWRYAADRAAGHGGLLTVEE